MHSPTLELPAPYQTEPVFSTNWSRGRSYWGELFSATGLTGRPGLRFLEIGCFEGRATLWLLENVLTDPTSRIEVIDTFEGSPEFEEMGIDGHTLQRFAHNIAPHTQKVTVMPGLSGDVIRTLPVTETYDFIYVDGSHAAADVLTDAVLAWPLLKKRGLLAFDDYKWQLAGSEHERPAIGIDAFRVAFGSQLALLYEGAQLAVAKL